MTSAFKLVIATTIILAIIIVGLILFVREYSKRVLTHQETLKQKEREKQSALLNATIDAQESERARIGSDIHDDIGPLLSTLKLYVNRIKLMEDAEERNAYIDSLGDQMDTVISEIRRVAKDLVPMVLIEFGLHAAIENLCRRIDKIEGLSIDFTHSALAETQLSKSEELAIYRIIQEFCNNSIKYAEASEIEICIESNPLSVRMSDNGKGFNLEHVELDQNRGLGLKNMTARAQAIEATLNLHSEESKGTQAELIFNTRTS